MFCFVIFKMKVSQAVVACAFNPSTWDAETGRFLSSRSAWSTEWVPGQPGLYRETLSQKTNKQTNKASPAEGPNLGLPEKPRIADVNNASQ